ncbi:MAG: hypothetical protein ACXWQQ_16330 [Pseudobdellovibrio sp.]
MKYSTSQKLIAFVCVSLISTGVWAQAFNPFSQERTGTSFKNASAAMSSIAAKVANMKKFKTKCIADFEILGTTPDAIATAASSLTFYDGMTSDVPRSSLYATSPIPLVAHLADLVQGTVGEAFRANPKGLVAMAQMGRSIIYLNAGLINPNAYYQNLATVLHELLHNVTSLTDSDIQRKFNIPEGVSSENISKKMSDDCL